jgi:hypothetical protein
MKHGVDYWRSIFVSQINANNDYIIDNRWFIQNIKNLLDGSWCPPFNMTLDYTVQYSTSGWIFHK